MKEFGKATTETEKKKVVLRSTATSTVDAAVRECLEICEWQRWVPRDGLVVIKPNLCTAVSEKIKGSNTHAAVTAAVCEVLLSRTNRIYIGESNGLRQTAHDSFAVSGYLSLAQKLGVKLVNFSEVPWVPALCEPAGEIELPGLLLEADAFITLPVLKTHALTYFTGALKNQWGCLPQYDRILLHTWLDELIVSLHRLLRPKLALMDAIVGMEGRGPTNGRPRRLDLVLASQDAVALDAAAMRLVSLEPKRARHIVLAAEQGLGVMAANQITLDGEWERHATQFERAILDKAISAMNYMSRYRWFVKYALEKDYVFYPVRAMVHFLRKVGVVEGG
jgi:uncharacterized protein (DUF362 family)